MIIPPSCACGKREYYVSKVTGKWKVHNERFPFLNFTFIPKEDLVKF